ncbi:MAG: ATP-binding protein [Legionellaceae bacterium]|nr:ATP-binding protein [Legionellaceae bacterium]
MYKRELQSEVVRLATQYPVVTITGPRQSGKTTLCQTAFPDYVYVNLEELSTREFANQDPKGFLAQYGSKVILDEIQRAPNLPSYIQPMVDQTDESGQFILTGSHQFELSNTINQSLAGRTALVTLLPLSFSELYDHQSSVSLSEILYSGFYPRIFNKKLNPTEAMSFYLSTYVERDIRSLINIKDLSVFEKFLKICATQIGQLLNYTTLANDCGVDQKTIKAWLSVLEASYIIFQIQPHFKPFRKRLTKSSKLYFHDVGFACYLLGISHADHVMSHPMRGLIFENFIISEFLKNRFNHVKDKNIYFFRDHVGNEVDMILDYGTHLYSVEIKSSSTFHYDFLKGLNYYSKLAEEKNTKKFLIYAGDARYDTHGVGVYSYKDIHQLFDDINTD